MKTKLEKQKHTHFAQRQCTQHKHIDQRKWCSVEVDGRGVHVSGRGRWGRTAPRPVRTTNMDSCGRICDTVRQ